MIISVASGKGGTGKTTVAVNLALSLVRANLLDCDVEEPNAHIFLKPKITGKEPVCVTVPEINRDRCTFCGKCSEVCEYHAMAVIKPNEGTKGDVWVFKNLCHGCGACSYLCPEKAVREIPKEIGFIEKGRSGRLGFVHGKLNIGETMAPPLIREVKKHIMPDSINIIDAPPGTSCPVIASIKGSDYCILVTEPTPFGLHDLELAVEVLRKMRIPYGAVINRADIGDDKVIEYLKKGNIPLLMEIPFDRGIAVLYSNGIPIVEKDDSYKTRFIAMFEKIKGSFGKR